MYFAALCWDELRLEKRKEIIENGRIAKNVYLGVPHTAGHSSSQQKLVQGVLVLTLKFHRNRQLFSADAKIAESFYDDN